MTVNIEDRDDTQAKWYNDSRLHRTIFKGTSAVHEVCSNPEAGEWLLPPTWAERKAFKDDNDASMYRQRVLLTIQLNFYARTAVYLSGQVFSKDIEWNLPKDMEYLIDNIDGKGTDASVFLSRIFLNGVSVGTAGAMVTMDGGGMTVSQAKASGKMPRLTYVAGENILGSRANEVRVSAAGERNEVNGYGTEIVDKVFLLTDKQITVYSKLPGKQYVVDGDSVKNTIGLIPFETFVPGQRRGLSGLSVLDDLAWIQLQHLRRTSDDEMYMNLGNNPILHTHGYDLTKVVTGLRGAYPSQVQDGSVIPFMKFAEPSGIIAGTNLAGLKRIEQAAALWGLQQLSPQNAPATATERNLGAQATQSTLSLWASEFEDFVQKCMVIAGKMIGEEIKEKCCKVNKDYRIPNQEEISAIIGAAGRSISPQTEFEELEKKGVISPQHGWEEEQERLEESRIAENRNGAGNFSFNTVEGEVVDK